MCVCVCVLGMRSMISGNVKIVEGAEFHIHIRGKQNHIWKQSIGNHENTSSLGNFLETCNYLHVQYWGLEPLSNSRETSPNIKFIHFFKIRGKDKFDLSIYNSVLPT